MSASSLLRRVCFITLSLFLHYASSDVNAANSSVGVAAFDGTGYLKIGSYNRSIFLIIGIDYQNTPSRLSYSPEADARNLAKVLEENYEVDEIHTLFGKAATKDSILNSINKIVAGASYDDAVFVFLGAYGVSDFKLTSELSYLNSISEIASDLACINRDITTEYSYVVPFDGSFENFEKNISLKEIDDLFLKLKSRHLYLVFDAPIKFTIPSGIPLQLTHDPDYLRKVFNQPVRNILIPSKESRMLIPETGYGKSPFASEIIDALLIKSDYLSASEIDRRVYYSNSSINTDPDFLVTGSEIIKYGEGDFFFTLKPEKRVQALSAEIGQLTDLLNSMIKNKNADINKRDFFEITPSEILNWDLLSSSLGSGDHELDKLIHEYIDKKIELILKRGSPFSEFEKEIIVSALNKFIKDNKKYSEDILKEFGISAKEKSSDFINAFLTEDTLSVNRDLLQRRYTDVFADTRNDYIEKIKRLENEKSFVLSLMKSAVDENSNLQVLSENNKIKESIKSEIDKESCLNLSDKAGTPLYKKAFFCIKKLNELIALEKEILNEKKKREADEMRASILVPLMNINRPRSLFETYEEYLFRKDSIAPLIVSGLENKIENLDRGIDVELAANENLKPFNYALSEFIKINYAIGIEEVKPVFSAYSNLQSKMRARKQGRGDETVPLVRRGADGEDDEGVTLNANWNYDQKKGRGHIVSEIEESELTMLPSNWEVEVSESEWKYLKDHKKEMEWQIVFTFNSNAEPELVESYIEDKATGKKYNLYPPFIFIKGGCLKKSWEENFDADKSPEYCVDSFYMERYEVTKEEIMNFTGIKNVPIDKFDHPATHVTWETANSYCNSLNSRYGGIFRLPSKTEWEYVASLSGENFQYITGLVDVTREKINIRGKAGYDEWDWTSPVGSFASNGFGVFDLAGNVDEWLLDWDGNELVEGTLQNYKGPLNGKAKIIIGGSWASDRTDLLFSTKRSMDPFLRNGTVGFRCVKENG